MRRVIIADFRWRLDVFVERISLNCVGTAELHQVQGASTRNVATANDARLSNINV